MVFFYGMKDLLVPIDQAGRVVLPKNVREELAIKAGDVFKVSVQGATVTLTRAGETSGFVRKGKALVFSTSGEETLTEETVASLLGGFREKPLREAEGLFSRRRHKA
jgi:AbrB family looped-hinge helix DNA binding protein